LIFISPLLFAGVSLVAAVLNVAFLWRALDRYRALLLLQTQDLTLNRIGRGFIYIWGFIVFDDVLRVGIGIAVFDHIPNALYLLLLAPFASILVAVIGLRSFR
jgi:hypothetical protein